MRRASISTPLIATENIGLQHPLYRWHRAYSTRQLRPVPIVIVGDSVAAGAGNSSASTSMIAYTRTLGYKLQQKLNSLPGFWTGDPISPLRNNEYTPGGGAFIRTAIPGLTDPWTKVGSPFTVNRGIGLNSMGFNASNASSTGTQYMELTLRSWQSCVFWYESGVGSVSPGVTVYDSAGTVLFNNASFPVDTGAAQYTRAVAGFDVLSGTRGQYKIRIGRNGATGTAVIDAVYLQDGDTNAGVRIFNYSWPGMVSGDYSGSTTAANTSAQATTVYQQPDLLIFYLGANDYGINVNPATYQANMSAVIDKYRAVLTKPPPVLLVAHFPRYDTLTPTYPWSQYVAALRAVAASKTESFEGRTVPYVDVLDLTEHFPTSAAIDTASVGLVVPSPTSGWGVHPTDRGHSWIAELLANKLMQPIAV